MFDHLGLTGGLAPVSVGVALAVKSLLPGMLAAFGTGGMVYYRLG